MTEENKEKKENTTADVSTDNVVEASIPSIWGSNSAHVANVRKARQMVGMEHGMSASVPIICRGQQCPYFETCWIPTQDLQVGERCPIEIGTIMERFDAYCKELNINTETEIVDAGLVKEVVDLEIMMVRADGLLAKDGSVIEDVVAGISNQGTPYYRSEIHKAAELKDKCRKEKTRILNQLNATRKDKKAQDITSSDPSSVAARIIDKVRKLEQKGKVIDVEGAPVIDKKEE